MGERISHSKLESISAGAVAPDAEEACLWKKLPRELQNKVLCYLPLQNLFQVRCVCKSWRDIILRRDFASMYDVVHGSELGCFAIIYVKSSNHLKMEWCTYDYAQNAWKKRTSVPPHSHPKLEPEDGAHYSVYPVGGLLVFRFWKKSAVSNWVVWNPLTNKWKTLPPCNNTTLEATSVFVHAFVADESAKRYKILMAYNPKRKMGVDRFDPGTSMVTELYDSTNGDWTRSESTLQYPLLPDDHRLMGKIHPTAVVCNGVIYFDLWLRRSDHSVGHCDVLLSYDIESEQWHDKTTHWAGTSMFEWNGHLMAGKSPHESGDIMPDHIDDIHIPIEQFVVGEWDVVNEWVENGDTEPDPSKIFAIFDNAVLEPELAASGNHLVLAGFS